jgi:uncharacterized protein
MDKKKNDLLIIFYRNAEVGKVKTRLASTLGAPRALEIYIYLTEHTKQITESIEIDKVVFYSERVISNDLWPDTSYHKAVQHGMNLGEKMKHAFEKAFSDGYKKVCIIGTDCLELTSEIIREGFDLLNTYDAVLGPAKDGGYYLLGMKKMHKTLFENKAWSTPSVAQDTIEDFRSLTLRFALLPELSDIDTVDDLPLQLRSI